MIVIYLVLDFGSIFLIVFVYRSAYVFLWLCLHVLVVYVISCALDMTAGMESAAPIGWHTNIL